MDQQFFTNNKQSIVASNRLLYTPSSFARSSLLHLQEIGELEAKKQHVSSRSNLASYLFFMVVAGSGNLTCNGKNYPLSKGSCVFVDCRKPYSHTTDPEDLWTLKWVHFFGPAMGQVFDKYCERGGQPVFVPTSLDEMDRVWNALMEVASGHDYMRDMLINQHLSTLLTLLMAESWHPEEAAGAGVKRASVTEVKEYLDRHYREKIKLDELAAQFYINKYYLTKVFKEQYGQSISSYLLNLRITKAKQLLRFSEKSIEEIGIEVGIGAPHYFSQVFKEVEGVPPSTYRKQW